MFAKSHYMQFYVDSLTTHLLTPSPHVIKNCNERNPFHLIIASHYRCLGWISVGFSLIETVGYLQGSSDDTAVQSV